MESPNDVDMSETGSRKRKKPGYTCMKQRQERIEEQFMEQKDENVVLQRMLEESKESVEQLTDELRIRNSRVMQLESDLFFMAGDLDEKSIVEDHLREMCKQLQLKVDKLEAEKRNDDNNREMCKQLQLKVDKLEAEKLNDKNLKNMHYKTKGRVLKAFEWEENTANPVLLRAVIEFWHAFAQRRTEDDENLYGAKGTAPFRWHAHLTSTVHLMYAQQVT